jgi:hypothetical protein
MPLQRRRIIRRVFEEYNTVYTRSDAVGCLIAVGYTRMCSSVSSISGSGVFGMLYTRLGLSYVPRQDAYIRLGSVRVFQYSLQAGRW